jgi:hypothetical protein
MAIFCTQCGTPAASDSDIFCQKCGAQLPAAAPESQFAQAPAPPPEIVSPAQAASPAVSPAAGPAAASTPVKASGGCIKVLVAVVAFFVLVGALGIGTCVYIGYKANQKAKEFRVEYGSGSSSPAAQARDVCSLITKEEVSQFTGVTVTSATGTANKCDYTSDTNALVLENDVGWEGARLGMKLGVMALKNMAGPNTIVQVPGIGDEAYTIALDAKTQADMQNEAQKDQSGTVKGMAHLMSMSPLMLRKGDTMVTVRVIEATDPDAAKKSIAKLVASRL